MKCLTATILCSIVLIPGCGKPVPVEISEVCSRPEGSDVIISGYISLPQKIDSIQMIRQGRIEAVGLQLFLMTKADATGDEVKTTFWVSDKGEPNKIKPLPKAYSWNDLLVYSHDGKSIAAGSIVKITGTVRPNDKSTCEVDVTKIESP